MIAVVHWIHVDLVPMTLDLRPRPTYDAAAQICGHLGMLEVGPLRSAVNDNS